MTENKILDEIHIPMALTEQALADMLTNWLECAPAEGCGFRFVDHKDADYEEAKAQLEAEGEDTYSGNVYARMLANKKSIKFLDPESDWKWDSPELNGMHWSWQERGHKPVGGDWKTLTLRKFLTGLAKYFQADCCNACRNIEAVVDEGDWTDVDAILQFAMYGELIYG